MPPSSSAGESVASRLHRKSPSRARPPVTDVEKEPLEKTVGVLEAGDAPVEASTAPPQRRISLANCIRKESGGLGRNKSGDIGRMIVKSLRADAYMYNTTLRNEEDVKIDARART